MAADKSASDIFATSGLAKLRTPRFFAAGVRAFPSGPWHATHFWRYVSEDLSCAGVVDERRKATVPKSDKSFRPENKRPPAIRVFLESVYSESGEGNAEMKGELVLVVLKLIACMHAC